MAKGRDLHADANDIDTLTENVENLHSTLEGFTEKLEMARERIEGAARLYQLFNAPTRDGAEEEEFQRLVMEYSIPSGLIDKSTVKNSMTVVEIQNPIDTNLFNSNSNRNHQNQNTNDNVNILEDDNDADIEGNNEQQHRTFQQQRRRRNYQLTSTKHHKRNIIEEQMATICSNSTNIKNNNNVNASNNSDDNSNNSKSKKITTASRSRLSSPMMGNKRVRSYNRSLKLKGHQHAHTYGSYGCDSCWRDSQNLDDDMDEMLADVDIDAVGIEDDDDDNDEDTDDDNDEIVEDDEEDDVDEEEEEGQSKIADSGLGGCQRCEANPKLSRVCSCQSLTETTNLYDKRLVWIKISIINFNSLFYFFL